MAPSAMAPGFWHSCRGGDPPAPSPDHSAVRELSSCFLCHLPTCAQEGRPQCCLGIVGHLLKLPVKLAELSLGSRAVLPFVLLLGSPSLEGLSSGVAVAPVAVVLLG